MVNQHDQLWEEWGADLRQSKGVRALRCTEGLAGLEAFQSVINRARRCFNSANTDCTPYRKLSNIF
jgi:hypothetical protein